MIRTAIRVLGAGVFPLLVLTLAAVIGLLGRSDSAFADNGDGTGNGNTILGTPVPLAQTYNVTLKGDYVSAGVGMRGTGPPGSGSIALPAIPGGATISQAFLYWSVMDDTEGPSFDDGIINGNPITGTLIGSTADPCWSTADTIFNYVADVTAYALPGAANALSGFASGGPPITTAPLLEGASIVLVYFDPTASFRTVVIHEGAVTFDGPPVEGTTMTNFTAVAGTSQTTYVMADGQTGLRNKTLIDNTETADFTLDGSSTPGTIYWDNLTQNISAFIPPADTSVLVQALSDDLGGSDCLTWVAQVLSVPAPAPPVEPPQGGIAEFSSLAGSGPVSESVAQTSSMIAVAGLLSVILVSTLVGGWLVAKRIRS